MGEFQGVWYHPIRWWLHELKRMRTQGSDAGDIFDYLFLTILCGFMVLLLTFVAVMILVAGWPWSEIVLVVVGLLAWYVRILTDPHVPEEQEQ